MPDDKNSRRQAAIDVRPLDHHPAHYSRAKPAQPGQFDDYQMRAHGANGMIEGVGSTAALRLAEDNPLAALAPVLDGSAPAHQLDHAGARPRAVGLP